MGRVCLEIKKKASLKEAFFFSATATEAWGWRYADNEPSVLCFQGKRY